MMMSAMMKGSLQRPHLSSLPPPLLMPAEALVRIEGQRGAFVLERDVASFIPLQLGEERRGRVIVEGGLDDDARVVLDPPPTLSSGDRVQLEESL